MRIEPVERRTPDGRVYSVRAGRAGDTGRVLDHAWKVHTEECEAFITEADEIVLTAEQLRGTLRRMREADNSMFLLAEADKVVIGTLSVEGGLYRKVKHNAVLGISVRREWRRQSVARALLEVAQRAARESGILRRLTLTVFETNEPAVRLYESLGYRVEGRRRGGVRLSSGYVDELIMALEVADR